MKNFLHRGVPFYYVAVCFVAVALAAASAGYFYYTLAEEAATSSAVYEAQVAELSTKLAEAEAENANLLASLQGEVDRNNAYGDQVSTLASTVGMLEKLSKTDRELLAKYSNVYFLSENFIPSPLEDIDEEYLLRKESGMQIHGHIKDKLQRMMDEAAEDGAPLLVLSSYRSFGIQAGLKASYSVTYGKGTANQFSADQGYSEHQLGSTVDFTTPEGGESLGLFEKSPGFAWLQEHAHKYGFVLSYPKGNGFFTFEPWHWRYVGVDLATRLHVEEKNFYDLDQREINTYLVRIFD